MPGHARRHACRADAAAGAEAALKAAELALAAPPGEQGAALRAARGALRQGAQGERRTALRAALTLLERCPVLR